MTNSAIRIANMYLDLIYLVLFLGTNERSIGVEWDTHWEQDYNKTRPTLRFRQLFLE